jgi:hypothetical protein
VVPSPGRHWRAVGALAVVGVVVGCAGFVVASGSARSAAGSPRVSQLEFPAVLAAPGEPLEVGYDTRKIPTASGFLYARNDTQRTFTRVRLQFRKASQQLVPTDGLRVLRATVPGSVVHGHKLFYYGVLRLGKAVLRIPAHLAERVWVLTGARVVKLGTHRFGNLRQAGPVVARAGPTDVGFDNPPEGAKTGPWSFDIAPDGSVWLLDNLNKRLLVWPRGQPDASPRAIPLGSSAFPWDFARGPAGSIYVTRRAPDSFVLQLFRQTETGEVLWQSNLATSIENQQLRVGPEGTLYWTGGPTGTDARRGERGGPSAWVPAASPDGRPFSTVQQRRRLTIYQPLPGGRRLVWTIADFEQDPNYGLVPHEERVALFKGASRLVRAWRIMSRTVIWPRPEATPALVGNDPVVVLAVSSNSWPTTNEYVVLRLAATSSGTRARFSLPSAGYADTGGCAAWET